MRYLVKARVKAGQEKPLLKAIADGSLGRGSIASDEYIYIGEPHWPSAMTGVTGTPVSPKI